MVPHMKLHFAFKGMFELAWVSVVCFGSRERVQRYLIQLIVQIKSLSSANWETDWLGNQRWTSCPFNPQQAPNSVFLRRLTPERTLKAFLKQDYTLIGALQFTADAEQDQTEVWMLSRYMTSSTLPLRQSKNYRQYVRISTSLFRCKAECKCRMNPTSLWWNYRCGQRYMISSPTLQTQSNTQQNIWAECKCRMSPTSLW